MLGGRFRGKKFLGYTKSFLGWGRLRKRKIKHAKPVAAVVTA